MSEEDGQPCTGYAACKTCTSTRRLANQDHEGLGLSDIKGYLPNKPGGLWDDCSDQITNRSEALQGTSTVSNVFGNFDRGRYWTPVSGLIWARGREGGREWEYPSFEAPVGSRNELAAAQMLVQKIGRTG